MRKLITSLCALVLLAMPLSAQWRIDDTTAPAGQDANKAGAVQGITGGTPVSVVAAPGNTVNAYILDTTGTRINPMTNETGARIDAGVTTLNATDFATEAKQDTQILQLGVIEGNGTTGTASLAAIELEQAAQSLQLGVIEGNGTTGTASLAAIEVEQLAQSLQLGVIEGNGTTGTASLAAIELEQAAQSLQLGVIEGNGLTLNATALLQLDEATTIKTNTQLILDEATTIKSNTADIKTAIEATGASAQEQQGTAADGAPAAGNPNVGGGVDGSANAQAWLSDTEGHQQIDILSLPSGCELDANNTTAATLGIGATFTGTATDLVAAGKAHLIVSVIADEDSAADGLVMQFSQDGTNWPTGSYKHTFTLSADVARTFQFGPEAQYFRVVLTNGGTGQGTLRLTTILKSNIGHTTMHRVSDPIDADRSVIGVQKSIVVVEKPSGDFVNAKGTAAGNPKVAIEEFEASLVGQDTMANSLSVVLPSDQSSVPVSVTSSVLGAGAATEAKQDVQEISLNAIEGAANTTAANTGTIAGAIAAGQMQVDVVAALPSGDNNIGNMDIVTMPNVTLADASTNTIGARFVYNPSNMTKTGDFSAPQTDTAIWTPAAGKSIVLMGVWYSTNGVVTVQLEDANVDVIPPAYLAAKGGGPITAGPAPLWIGDPDDTLDFTSSAAVDHSVLAWGYEQ